MLTPTVDEIRMMIQSLPAKERVRLLASFGSDTARGSRDFIGLDEARFTDGLYCPRCGCTGSIVRYGTGNGGKQRYRCNECRCYFTAATNTFLASTKKNLAVWEQYIKCMVRGLSIRKAATECDINTRTAFMWRHKILDALGRAGDKEEHASLKGIVEADETFSPLSFKGNKDMGFQYPGGRGPRKRGGECSRRISLRHILPRCSGSQNPQNAVQNCPWRIYDWSALSSWPLGSG